MKKLTVLLLLIFVVVQFSFAQHKKDKLKKKAVPAVVSNAFHEKFLNAKKTTWFKNDSNFLVVFLSDSYKLNALYDAQGKWQETKLFIKELPLEIMKTHYDSFYNNWIIRKKIKIETANANYYLLEVHYDEMIRELIYDEGGQLLKQKIIKQ